MCAVPTSPEVDTSILVPEPGQNRHPRSPNRLTGLELQTGRLLAGPDRDPLRGAFELGRPLSRPAQGKRQATILEEQPEVRKGAVARAATDRRLPQPVTGLEP